MTDLDEPIFGDHLPDAIWLPLGLAMLFALCGRVPLDNEPWEACEIEPRPGTVLYGVTTERFDDAFLDFEKALHRAAAADVIRFRGVRVHFSEDARNVDGENSERIPPEYFGQMQRGFDEAEQKIGVASLLGDLDLFEPANKRPTAHAEWLGVVVERATFVSFLQVAYPGGIWDSAEPVGRPIAGAMDRPAARVAASAEEDVVEHRIPSKPQAAPQRRQQKPSRKRDGAVALLEKRYPDGRPRLLTEKEILKDVTDAGHFMSSSTLHRALKLAWASHKNAQ